MIERSKENAIFSANPEWTKRLCDMPEHAYRSKFQRDRDRILYSKEFRRLSGKTQVFVSGFDDNIRTRLTHTLEVSQIANTISSALGLNTELTEAIALGHDVGHTPFGHVGERTLNYVMNGCIPLYGYESSLGPQERGFKHNLQGAKVVTKLEKYNNEEPGLNLTLFTIWGIVNHTKQYYGSCGYFQENEQKCHYKNQGKACQAGKLEVGYYAEALKYNNDYMLIDERDWTFEALVVAMADEIAQRHHDIEDGMYAGIIDYGEIIEYIKAKFDYNSNLKHFDLAAGLTGYGRKAEITSSISRTIVNMYVTDAINSISVVLNSIKKDLGINSAEDFGERRSEVYEYLTNVQKTQKKVKITDAIHFSEELTEKDKEFKEFLVSRILQSELAQSMDGKAAYIIRQLIKAYLTNPQQLPDATIIRLVIESGIDKLDVSKEAATVASQARRILQKALVEQSVQIRHKLLRIICDYIAGMTDQYAYIQYNKLYGTNMIINGWT